MLLKVIILYALIVLWIIYELRHPLREIFKSEPGLEIDSEGHLNEITVIKKEYTTKTNAI